METREKIRYLLIVAMSAAIKHVLSQHVHEALTVAQEECVKHFKDIAPDEVRKMCREEAMEMLTQIESNTDLLARLLQS